MSTPSKVIAVLVSDLHFTLNTLEEASTALISARSQATQLQVPLIIGGDTVDGKAILRGECVNRLLSIFNTKPKDQKLTDTYILIGNHDLLNEKGTEHALNFLKGRDLKVIDAPHYEKKIDTWLLPYFNDAEKLKETLSTIPKGSRVIMHQGVQTAFMGHYIQDRTSLPKEVFADYRVISGHYHRAQDIKCGHPRKGAVGLFSYIGSSYTTSFAEAQDGPKGYQLLKEDGTLELIPLNIRKHVIYECEVDKILDANITINKSDLLWLKVRGPYSELKTIKKQELAKNLGLPIGFKLDLIPTDSDDTLSVAQHKLTDFEIMDQVIDNTKESDMQKKTLKNLWRSII